MSANAAEIDLIEQQTQLAVTQLAAKIGCDIDEIEIEKYPNQNEIKGSERIDQYIALGYLRYKDLHFRLHIYANNTQTLLYQWSRFGISPRLEYGRDLDLYPGIEEALLEEELVAQRRLSAQMKSWNRKWWIGNVALFLPVSIAIALAVGENALLVGGGGVLALALAYAFINILALILIRKDATGLSAFSTRNPDADQEYAFTESLSSKRAFYEQRRELSKEQLIEVAFERAREKIQELTGADQEQIKLTASRARRHYLITQLDNCRIATLSIQAQELSFTVVYDPSRESNVRDEDGLQVFYLPTRFGYKVREPVEVTHRNDLASVLQLEEAQAQHIPASEGYGIAYLLYPKLFAILAVAVAVGLWGLPSAFIDLLVYFVFYWFLYRSVTEVSTYLIEKRGRKSAAPSVVEQFRAHDKYLEDLDVQPSLSYRVQQKHNTLKETLQSATSS